MSYRIDWIQGSSPLTRGKHRLPLAAYRACGLIPAHAGKTTYDGDPTMTAQAHPRSRGENPELRVCLRRVRGSSPLTRGKHARGSRAAADPGLIPAHAGKTSPETSDKDVVTAHPRSRGENPPEGLKGSQNAGSSPLTRGKLRSSQSDRLSGGLIPAHAGKTPAYRAVGHDQRAHPRSRGENIFARRADQSLTGSSPLTRGKHRRNGPEACRRGLIPAHAGKTWNSRV